MVFLRVAIADITSVVETLMFGGSLRTLRASAPLRLCAKPF